MAESGSDVVTGICFEVSADGVSLGSFAECAGLVVEVANEELYEGGSNGFVYRLPTRVRHPMVVLRRGITASQALARWVSTFVDSARVTPKRVEIALRTPGQQGMVVRAWTLLDAYPLKWEGPRLDAIRGAVAFEAVELAHRGLVESNAGRA